MTNFQIFLVYKKTKIHNFIGSNVYVHGCLLFYIQQETLHFNIKGISHIGSTVYIQKNYSQPITLEGMVKLFTIITLNLNTFVTVIRRFASEVELKAADEMEL